MSVGLTKGQGDINNRLSSCALDLRGVMDRIRIFKIALDTMTDTELKALAGSPQWVQADVDLLRSAAADMDQIRTIWAGTATLGSVKDFQTFTKLVTGVV